MLLLAVIFIAVPSYAQQWELPFKVVPDSMQFNMPSNDIFAPFDSAFVVLKIRFKETENRVKWVDIVKLDLFKADTSAYHFFNDVNSGWSVKAEPLAIEDYPDQITKELRKYLQTKLTGMCFEPTEYVDEYRLIPFTVPVRLR